MIFHRIIIQWNPDFSNPRFLTNPDNSNQKSFPLDLFHCNFTPDISNSRFLRTSFRFPWRFEKSRDSTVLHMWKLKILLLCRESERVVKDGNFLQLSSAIIKHGSNERKLSTTPKNNLSRFKFNGSAQELPRVAESAWEFLVKREREIELLSILVSFVVWFGLHMLFASSVLSRSFNFKFEHEHRLETQEKITSACAEIIGTHLAPC